MFAPRTAALSIPAYGINIHTEHECVIAGTAWAAYDVWNKPAPTFENFPLDTTNMVGKMYTSPDNPNMPKMKTDLSKLKSKDTFSGYAAGYWKGYDPKPPKPVKIEDLKVGDILYNSIAHGTSRKVVKIENGKVYLDNDKGYGLEDTSYFYKSQGDAIDAHDDDNIKLTKLLDAQVKKAKTQPPVFNPGTKISGVEGSNFADTEFTVNSLNRNGTMDVTSEYGTPYAGVKPHLFQTSTKVQGKFKVGDKLNYGTVAKYEVVKGPYKTYNITNYLDDVGYDIKDLSGKIYKNEVLPSYVTKEEPKSIPKEMSGYKVGDIIKGNLSGNIYKIDKIEDGIANLIVKKTGPHGNQNPGDTNAATPKGLKASYTKVESEAAKDAKTFKTSEKYQKSLDKFKVGQTVYSKYQSGKGYVITGFMKNGDLDTKEINLKTGNPTDHYAQLVPDLIYTSKEDAKKSPESKWGKR